MRLQGLAMRLQGPAMRLQGLAMRLQGPAAGLCAAMFVTGCGLVFGISSGEYDPDPFGLGGGSGGGGGDGGSGSGGGASGSGGGGATDTGTEPPPCTALLDDLEDGDGSILRCKDRVGSWYTYNDGTRGGTQTPLPGRPFLPISPGREPSNYAAHVAGSGFVSRGAGMGFDLNFAPGGAKLTYDASAYSGLTFWAKAAAPTHIYVNFPDRNTDREGGVCEGSGCGDHFGEGLDITTEWAQYTVMFSILSTDGWGVPAPPAYDPAHAYSIEFHTAKSTVFDFVVDDIAFVP